MWDQIWCSSSLPYSGAKTTAAVETPSHTIAEATRFLWGRTILKSPSWHVKVPRCLREQHPNAPVVVVDP
jgi:hypothetical protein